MPRKKGYVVRGKEKVVKGVRRVGKALKRQHKKIASPKAFPKRKKRNG